MDESFRAKTGPPFPTCFLSRRTHGDTDANGQVRWLQPDCRFSSEAINLSSKPENLLSVRLFFTAIGSLFLGRQRKPKTRPKGVTAQTAAIDWWS
jgi:hypothetical protein